MNFNGSKHFPKNELVNYLQSIGVKFGADLNAYTGFDETVYILPLPTDDPKKIDEGFTILEDWAGNALLDTSEINKERGVVLEESRLGKGAQERMSKKYLPELFNGSKYAKRLPIGIDDTIRNFKPQTLHQFYKTCRRCLYLQQDYHIHRVQHNQRFHICNLYFRIVLKMILKYHVQTV